ncbi:hypothetical protein IB236_18185 [Acidovorax sp. ACV02]|uniref:hypothetical protein n=1 Tax=Acidovorax sp. ACV02 TaxID=2769310 RepID=UPI00178468F1|nr:hypothetical protein [Acidovorax sp. ACV02]MBD9407276.1 hypothetical protein [Acidovorax sp. ACV02]
MVTKSKAPAPASVVNIKTTELIFDPENPRFYRLNSQHSMVENIIEDMLDQEGAQDLMLSIGQKGYFAGEPLLVISPKKKGEAFTVVEGNRRLAAVKLLNGEIVPPKKRQRSVAIIQGEAIEPAPTELPCLVYENRRDVLRYLGYRHITGIQEWDALSKARYLKELRDEFYPNIDESEQFKNLAKDIGSKADYVAKLLTALNLYEKSKDNNNFHGLKIDPADIEFSYITTALGYKNIPDWLGLATPKDVEMPGVKMDNLAKMFGWFFAKDQHGRTIIGESRNISDLAAIVTSDKAIAALEETGSISTAYLYTDGPNEALEKSLQEALAKIQIAWRMVPDAKHLTSSHEDLANEIFDHGKTLRNSIRDKLEDQ